MTNPLEEAYHAYIKNSEFYRGVIISQTIQLERLIDEFIARYFIPGSKKKLELMELLISDRMSFNDKADVFIHLLKKKCEILGKDFKAEFPRIAKDFQEIAKDRNRFAHDMSALPSSEDEYYQASIILVPFKNGAQKKLYYAKDISIITERLTKYTKIISMINDDDTGEPTAQ